MTSFDESLHPRGQAANAGQFATKTNDAPTATLGATSGASLEAILRERATAAAIHAQARATYLRSNRDAAIATLREQFPGAQMAIFTRNWDDDAVKLHQVLGETDIDFTVGPEWEALTVDQRKAGSAAESWIQEMGDDVELYVEPSEEEHDDWYEYQLDLTEQPAPSYAAGELVGNLAYSERSALDTALSDTDGRAISTFDTHEIAYQLQEGYWAEADNLAFADKLTARYGTIESAADAIAATPEWEELRDEVDRHAREQMIDHIGRAATNLIWAEDAE